MNNTKPSSKFWILFLALFILGLFFLGGTYAFVVLQKVPNETTPLTNQQAADQKQLRDLEDELEKVNTKSLESDFLQIEQEMKNL